MSEEIQGVGPQKNSGINYTKSVQKPMSFEPIFKLRYQPEELFGNKKEFSKAAALYNEWKNVPVDEKLSKEFFENILEASKRLKCDPEDLIALIYGESRFNPAIVSSDGKYNGLIQMTGASLRNSIKYSLEKYGEKSTLNKDITIEKYLKLPASEQVKYAEAYLDMLKDSCNLNNKKLDGGTLWTLIRSPKNINNKKFKDKLAKEIEEIKLIPLKYETPYCIKDRDNY